MSLIHWNYFLAIEDDVNNLSRYIEFDTSNYSSYSIETAKILMSSTQEIDVLLKQICQKHGNSSSKEQGYRTFLPTVIPKLINAKVEYPRYNIDFEPFLEWQTNQTPFWWTANNKIKHQRNTNFSDASLKNMLYSVSALLLVNLYYYDSISKLDEIFTGTKNFIPVDMITSVSPTIFGMSPNYKIPS